MAELLYRGVILVARRASGSDDWDTAVLRDEGSCVARSRVSADMTVTERGSPAVPRYDLDFQSLKIRELNALSPAGSKGNILGDVRCLRDRQRAHGSV